MTHTHISSLSQQRPVTGTTLKDKASVFNFGFFTTFKHSVCNIIITIKCEICFFIQVSHQNANVKTMCLICFYQKSSTERGMHEKIIQRKKDIRQADLFTK